MDDQLKRMFEIADMTESALDDAMAHYEECDAASLIEDLHVIQRHVEEQIRLHREVGLAVPSALLSIQKAVAHVLDDGHNLAN